MRRIVLGILGFFFSLLAAAAPAPAPLRLAGRLLPPIPADPQIELFPLVSSHAEGLRQLAGESVPPAASAQPRPDGSFELRVPENGLYRVRVRAEGRLAVEYLLIPLVEDTEIPPVRLQPVSPLEITVLGPDGRPVPNLRVRALSAEALQAGSRPVWRPAQSEGTTNAAGKVTLPQGGIGELSLVTFVPGTPDRVVTKIEGPRTTLRLARRAPRVLEVRGKEGKPLAGVLARWNFMPFGVTGSDGRLPFPEPVQGATLRLETADGPLAEVHVAPDTPGKLTVQLPADRTATGRVLDVLTRAPLAGALVWSDWHRPARTDARGRFKLPVFGDDVSIGAAAADHLFASAGVSPRGDRPTTLVLQPAALLAGLVVDGAGQPVTGAEVDALPESYDDSVPAVSVHSGADGRFRLAGLAQGKRYQIRTTHQGFAPAATAADAMPPGKGTPLRIVLQRGSTASGLVVDTQGQPVAGVELSLRRMGLSQWQEEVKATSDRAGRFRFTDLAAGRFDLAAVRHGFAPQAVQGIEIPAQPGTVDLGEITLEAGAVLEGLVTDRRGVPITGAEIDSLCPDLLRLGWRPMRNHLGTPSTTDAQGRFRVEDLQRGAHCDLNVRSAGYATAHLPDVPVPTPEPLRVELASARRLTGRVVGPQGEPVPEAEISLIESREILIGGGSSGSSSSRGAGRTDRDGRFELADLTAGLVDLAVSASGYQGRVLHGVEVPEDGGEPLEIALAKGEALEGLVRNSRGEPVAGARIAAWPQRPPVTGQAEAVSDGDGFYRLEGLRAGPYEIQAEGPNRESASSSLEIQSGVNHFDITFPGGVAVSGRVFDPAGAPVPGAAVTLRPTLSGEPLRTISSADGSFEWRAVPDGVYQISGEAQGFAETEQPGDVIVSGQAVRGLQVRIERGALLTGRLLGMVPDQSRVTRVMAFRHTSGSAAIRNGTSAGESYRIVGLTPGEWNVMIQLQDGRYAQGSIAIDPGVEQATLDIELASGFTLSGRLLVDGAAMPDAEIFLRGGPDLTSGGQATTAYDGGFRISGLKAGRHRLVVAGPSGIGDNREIEITGDRSVMIEIATGSLSGQVLSPQGTPIADALVSLNSEASAPAPGFGFGFQGPTLRSHEDGRFELGRLGAGTYRITVQRQGFSPAESRFTVTPGGAAQVQVVLKELPGS